MHLEFVVPCYNEEQVLPLSLKALEAIGDRLLADGAVQKVKRHMKGGLFLRNFSINILTGQAVL